MPSVTRSIALPTFDAADPFAHRLAVDGQRLARRSLRTLQLNLGKMCNIACAHCHVEAGPKRKEIMTWDTMRRVLDWIDTQGGPAEIEVVDMTGGSPEMNPHFRDLVVELKRRGLHLLDRCNPTIIEEPGYEDLPQFLAEHGVEIVASLPCYLEDNVDAQRGNGVFEKSIAALRKLNAVGYGVERHVEEARHGGTEARRHGGGGQAGREQGNAASPLQPPVLPGDRSSLDAGGAGDRSTEPGTCGATDPRATPGAELGELRLDLVYNPVGFGLPPAQAALERDYKKHLRETYGITFNTLWTITNMPIKRFGHALRRDGRFDAYMGKLIDAHNADNVEAVMCRDLVSVGWRGTVYDCDFNQMLQMPLVPASFGPCDDEHTVESEGRKLWDYSADELHGRAIRTGAHCFGCTAGAGSSCTGALLT